MFESLPSQFLKVFRRVNKIPVNQEPKWVSVCVCVCVCVITDLHTSGGMTEDKARYSYNTREELASLWLQFQEGGPSWYPGYLHRAPSATREKWAAGVTKQPLSFFDQIFQLPQR